MQLTEPEITETNATKLGLSSAEFEKISQILGRTPNFTELSIFSVMWSERCSHKNSIKWLKTLPREGKRLLAGAGNDGLVDIGDGNAYIFKIESQNYPSTNDPNQGEALIVSSTHRYIFTKGARPIASLNSLYFGNPDLKAWKGVVQGIGEYNNSFGVPTVASEVFFHESFNQNIIVNAMSVGIEQVGETVSARADGPGNPVFIVGSCTGKDGLHEDVDLSVEHNEDLSTVKLSDPFQEKLLLEASLEAIKTGAVVGIQSVGAAGITASTAQMCAKSETGMRIDLSKVPTRQADMQAWEILLSESQGRMLVVGKLDQAQALYEVFEKWDLECVEIGEVTDTGNLEYFHEGEKVAETPAHPLVLGGGAPVYDREHTKPAYLNEVAKFKLAQIEKPKDYKAAARNLFSLPNLVSKRWVYEQNDIMAHCNDSCKNAPSDAAIILMNGSKKSLTVTLGCNPTYVHADPYVGAMISVSEAARNIICSGGEPVSITNCLNFGDPYNPAVYYQFVNAIKGIGDACRKFNIPVTGNHVSFYNQSKVGDKTEPIFPTPTIGMLGILEDASHKMSLNFKAEGDVIYMLGNIQNDLGSSEYLRNVLGVKFSPAPHFELHEEFEIQKLVIQLIRKKWLRSAHDVSVGGLFTNLMESAIASGIGFNIETMDTFRKDCFLFGESQSRIVITLSPDKEDEFQNYLGNNNVSFTKLGEVFGTEVVIDDENFGSVAEWKLLFDDTLSEKFDN